MSDSMEIMAFPLAGDEDFFRQDGMTLRDYFAAKAMQGMLAHAQQDYSPMSDSGIDNVATDAYKIADAMLLSREA